MTCIATAITKSGYEIASDSHYFTGNDIYRVNNKKIFNISGLLVGASSSNGSGIINILEYISCLEGITTEFEFDKINKFLKILYKSINEQAMTNKPVTGWKILVNDGEKICHVCESGIVEISEKYAVIGYGREYAMGALHSITDINDTGDSDCEIAIAAAKYYCTKVSGDTQLIRVKR
jgi:ATP-dependent protease HslVU (ClpYQ) peptidase subunit